MFAKRKVPKHSKPRIDDGDSTRDLDSEALELGSEPQDIDALTSAIQVAKKRKVLGKAPLSVDSRNNEGRPAELPKTTYESDRSLGLGKDQKATATAAYDTDIAHDHRAVLERNQAIGEAIVSGELAEGIYRGLGAHRSLIKKREGAIAAGKFTGSYGPVRGNQHVRMTMRVDLNPEICKDYKETGYCGYGDTCIFLHDRTDYKSGWQLEKEWEQKQKEKQERDARRLARRQGLETGESVSEDSDDVSSDDDEKEKLPFACLLCKQKWSGQSNPIVTQCGHYFCEACAMQHYAKSSKCAKCGEQTNGIFNSAARILSKLSEVT